MFNNVGWGEMLILVIAGLVILGPERLPGAMRWTANAVRQVRDYVSGATNQLRRDLGPEFDELREPLSELQKLRGMTPRAAITKHLLDGDDSIFTGNFDTPDPRTPTPQTQAAQNPAAQNPAARYPAEPAEPGPERRTATPFDPDAT
ncbi:Sec-independent protein translocase protein TatB [uncultured Mycolicibacterium sp.]|uniref:Sec-independent protein translocase protein TatB n=1 Tax=uncultured Mycolicibacterium sp. TaxID=2320817 RepID=UPI0034537759